MKKNAFTLIEMIATIGLLGMLATITITVSVRKINETKESARDAMIQSIELAATKYANENEIEELNNYDNAYITLQTLVEKEYFTESLVDPTTKKNIPLTNEIYITREENGTINSKYNKNQRKEPKLTLIGSYNEYVEVGKEYQELGVTAINPNKQDVSTNVTITGTVDTTTPNTYKITYELDNVKITRNVIVYSGNLGTEELIPVDFETDNWKIILKSVKSGNHPYKVGDTKTIDMGSLGTHTLRVANTTKCSEVEVKSQTACGFVLEFADVITTAQMNSSSTNAGGWPVSTLRTYLKDTILPIIEEEIGNIIIDTYVVSGVGSGGTTGYENVVDGNFYSSDKLYLLSTYEVWGSNPSGNDTAAMDTITRQLDYYATYEGDGYIGVSTTKNEGAIKNNSSGSASYWWLRSAFSNNSGSFIRVGISGYSGSYDATDSRGVSPAFRLAE